MKPARTEPITWNGTPERAKEIDEFCRTSSLLPRWQWLPLVSGEARVLVEPEEGAMTSAEWLIVPVGGKIERVVRDDQDSVLRLRMPPEA